MYLKSFTMENYRKYRKENNKVLFSSGINKSGLIGSTVIVGQNNAGKTSIVTALKKASRVEPFMATDFNFNYLYNILEYFYANSATIKKVVIDGKDDVDAKKTHIISELCPFMGFGFEFKIDVVDKNSEELLTNIAPLIKNDVGHRGIVRSYVKYELKEQLKFINDFYTKFISKTCNENTFIEFMEFLTKADYFETNVYTDYNCTEKVDGFSINALVKVNTISFEKLHTSGRLSTAFNKIYNYQVSNNPEVKMELEEQVKVINQHITNTVSINKDITEKVNSAMEKAFNLRNTSMLLKSDLTIDSLLKNVIKYVYKDGKFEIPEDQFGMGYTNLMLIVAELIDYIDNSPESLFRNTINVLVIEEPESYMHPQMQKLLIKYLNDVVISILSEREKKVKLNCQLIITSHSANIIHGKLHSENTFNNLNYISCADNQSAQIVPLNDCNIFTPQRTEYLQQQFNFLKKHIEYNCCELFFADACIVVEGYAEETVLPFYIERDARLNKRYISILKINGAFAHVYKNLFKILKIPVAIITDIDIKGSNDSPYPLTCLDGKETTNSTLKYFKFVIGTDFSKQEKNIKVVTQGKVSEYYPTSFEESMILSNVDNSILHKALSETLPEKYKENKSDIASKAHVFQNQLSCNNRKGMFATRLLFHMLNTSNDADIPNLPQYIQCAFNFIATSLDSV